METLRVLVDSGEPCPDCGAPATVYQRAVDGFDLEWLVELVECSHGCAEVAAVIAAVSAPKPAARPAPKQASKRRRRVA